MKNQAVVDIEDYYSMRKSKEANELYIKELKKKEGELLEQMKGLKMGLIVVLTNRSANIDMMPPFEVTAEGMKLIVIIKSNTIVSDKFNDVQIKTK